MKSKIEKIEYKWYPNKIVELLDGTIVLTASGENCGTVLVCAEKDSKYPIGYVFQRGVHPLEMYKIKRCIYEPVTIKFN